MKSTCVALFIFGTRPEAIKMAPVVRAFRSDPGFRTLVCVTGQHRAMLDQVLEFFELTPDFDLDLMEPNQTLSSLAGNAISKTAAVIIKRGASRKQIPISSCRCHGCALAEVAKKPEKRD